MQTDPIGLSGGLNLYAYTGNDPVNASDPGGTSLLSDFARFVSSIGGAISNAFGGGGGGFSGGGFGNPTGPGPNGAGNKCQPGEVCVTGTRPPPPSFDFGNVSFGGGSAPSAPAPGFNSGGGGDGIDQGPELVVTAEREKNCDKHQKEVYQNQADPNNVNRTVNSAIKRTTPLQYIKGQAGYNVPRNARYVSTRFGVVDLQHVTSASYSLPALFGLSFQAGFALEVYQYFSVKYKDSAFREEDFLSNAVGAYFGFNPELAVKLLGPVPPKKPEGCGL